MKVKKSLRIEIVFVKNFGAFKKDAKTKAGVKYASKWVKAGYAKPTAEGKKAIAMNDLDDLFSTKKK